MAGVGEVFAMLTRLTRLRVARAGFGVARAAFIAVSGLAVHSVALPQAKAPNTPSTVAGQAASPQATQPSGGVAAEPSALQALQSFLRDARTGSADFTQTVISPDGAKRRVSSGTFEFSRPDRFRFSYAKPFEQVIVADGQRLWIHDPELNQVVSRRQAGALSATPAALLAGSQVERSFTLTEEPPREGLAWVKAVPRKPDAGFESLRIGFREGGLASVEILDSLGQRSVLQFSRLRLNVPLAADRLVFVVPKGADVLEQ